MILKRATFYILISLVVSTALNSQELPHLSFRSIDIWSVPTADNTTVRVLEDSHGYLWITSTSGLYTYDGSRVTGYFQSADPTSISSNYSESILQHSNGDIWVGTLHGLNRYVREIDVFERVGQADLGVGRISVLYEDKFGDIWIGGELGLMHYKDNQFKLYTHDLLRIESPGFRMVMEDPLDSSTLWIGGVGGLFRFDLHSKEFEHFPMHRPSPGNLEYMIMTGHLDDKNVMWCATWGTGIVPIDLNKRKWLEDLFPFPNDSLWHEVVYQFIPYEVGSFWVATNEGFGIFSALSKEFNYYKSDETNPLSIHNSQRFIGICKTRQGNIVAAGSNKISISLQEDDVISQIKFPPVADEIMINGRSVQTDTSHSYLRNLYLEDEDKDVSISFITPGNYSNLELQYAYFLEGYDRAWIDAEAARSARYTNLPIGEYTFRFRCRLAGQDWVEGRSIRLHKSVLFVKRPIFYIMAAGFVIIMILILYRLRVQNIRNREQLKTEFNKKLASVEMSALRAQMNPHFMFNSLNSIKYYILNQESDKANKYLTKFSKLMRQVLNNSKSALVTLADEMSALNLYIELESLRFTEDFHFRIDIASDIDESNIFIPPLLIQPYVENAIWHGLLRKNAPGQLFVSARIENCHLVINIEDNGIGREAAGKTNKSAPGRSFGTQITNDRIDLINETLGIGAKVNTIDLNDQGRATGTLVTIQIPLLTEAQVDALELNTKR